MANGENKLWGTADTYERYMGRWSRKVAPLFIDWLNAEQAKSWADIGCGTGILSSQISAKCEPGYLVGIDMSATFIEHASAAVPSAEFRAGDAANVDLTEASFDYAVSGLVLNFVPDKPKALSEMARIVRPGGTVGLYVWDYAGQMQIMRYFFDIAREFDEGSATFDDGLNALICRPQRLSDAFAAAGLSNVETTAIDITTAFVDFDDYWTPFLGGTGSAPKYCASLDNDLQTEIREAIRHRLPTGPDGEILLAARAWAVKGIVSN